MRYRLHVMSFLVTALIPAVAFSWIYPEHRDIAVAAVKKLSPKERATLESLWDKARTGYSAKLCESIEEGDQGLSPECLDFAAIPALTGDHSCSPQEVMDRILPSDWIFDVAKVAAETKRNLAEGRSRIVRLNALATSNLRLQVADEEYATRAGANNAHFLLPRVTNELADYTKACFEEGAQLNALGLYGEYHIAAMALAQSIAANPPPEPERSERIRQAIILEGFSLHWLQDLYASGHMVGTWGSAAWRKGTHDYYNEFGADVSDWKGKHIVAYGDANMKATDLERSSQAVAESLQQFIAAWTTGDDLGKLAKRYRPDTDTIFAFNACKEETQPTGKTTGEMGSHFANQLSRMPVPALGPGEVHLPRFRDEMGLFVGVFGGLGFTGNWTDSAGTFFNSNLVAGGRIGFGADSLTGSIGTGIAFLEAGFFAAGSETLPCSPAACADLGAAALFPGVPARTGLRLGLRLPFWVIPGDVLILAPVLALTSKRLLNQVMVEAASGGLIPIERSFRTSAGIFQVVAGREVNVDMVGLASDVLAVVPIGPRPDGSAQNGVVKYKSLNFSFPVIEWTPFRTFATQLTFSTVIQLGFGVSVPLESKVLSPAGYPDSAGGNTWSMFLRGQFDGRYFFGSREDLKSPR